MSQEDLAPIAEAKEDGKPPRAPLRLMTQFLKAVSESRMEDALALAQTILMFEPHNAIILDYQTTLAQYINNERELAAEDVGGTDDGGEDDDDGDDGDGSSEEELPSGSTGSEDVSTEEASDEDVSERHQTITIAGRSNTDSRGRAEQALRQDSVNVELETQRLGGLLRDLRETRAAESEDAASRWDETKFAATQREVEEVLWKFLPEEAKQAAQKRAEEDASDHHQDNHQHRADHK